MITANGYHCHTKQQAQNINDEKPDFFINDICYIRMFEHPKQRCK